MRQRAKRTILFPSNDIKFQEWKKELQKCGINAISNIGIYPKIIIIILKNKRSLEAIIFRYLNDRNTLFKSVGILLTDIIVIFVALILKIKIIWILHNVDKETIVNYKWISVMRRFILKIFSDKILVTDPLLINYAIDEGFPKQKLRWTCFGPPPNNLAINHVTKDLRLKINNFKNSLQVKYPNKEIIIGLCVSSPSAKKTHYMHSKLLTRNCKNEYVLALVIYGMLPSGKEFSHLMKEYKENNLLLYINDSENIQERYLANSIDYIYRSLNDLSVAYSVYVAASINKPIITHDCGFLHEHIVKNKLGYIIPINSSYKVCDVPELIINWKQTNSRKFLKRQNWRIGARNIASCI